MSLLKSAMKRFLLSTPESGAVIDCC